MDRGGAGPRSPRDRYIDLLRVLSLSMVVLGHWLAVLVTWEDGTVTGRNALNVVPGMWPLTWIFQVMPLFFFVGGFSNRKSYESVCRRGGGYVAYVTRRLQRLLVPAGDGNGRARRRQSAGERPADAARAADDQGRGLAKVLPHVASPCGFSWSRPRTGVGP